MKSTPFNPDTDLAPMPFSKELCASAARMQEKGVPWRPHAGCFVWDRHGIIEVPSPFPNRIYFILNLGHFLNRFGSMEEMERKLVWLPTWHQALQICNNLNISEDSVESMVRSLSANDPEGGLLRLYELISKHIA